MPLPSPLHPCFSPPHFSPASWDKKHVNSRFTPSYSNLIQQRIITKLLETWLYCHAWVFLTMLKQLKGSYTKTPITCWMNSLPSFYYLLPITHVGNTPSHNTLLTFQSIMCKPNSKKAPSRWQQAGLFLKSKPTQNKWSHSQASASLTQSFHAVFFNTSHKLNCSPALCYYLMRCYLYKTFVYYFRLYLHWTPDSPCVCI